MHPRLDRLTRNLNPYVCYRRDLGKKIGCYEHLRYSLHLRVGEHGELTKEGQEERELSVRGSQGRPRFAIFAQQGDGKPAWKGRLRTGGGVEKVSDGVHDGASQLKSTSRRC